MITEVVGVITHVSKVSFTNRETGEVNQYCRVDYLVREESTQNSQGYVSLDCYTDFDNYGIMCDYLIKKCKLELVGKLVNAEINGVTKKVTRFSISKIDGKSLS